MESKESQPNPKLIEYSSRESPVETECRYLLTRSAVNRGRRDWVQQIVFGNNYWKPQIALP
jgi:hypothetical protein